MFNASLKRELETVRPNIIEKTNNEQMMQLALVSDFAFQNIQSDMALNCFRHLQSYLFSLFLMRDIVM